MPKISALTSAPAPDADDLLYIVEDGNSRKATIEQVVKTATNATGNAPVYACRAWVNFNGTGVVTINASGNVSSITDNGTGDYTVNFTTAMPDSSFAAVATSQIASGSVSVRATDYVAGSVKILTNASGAAADASPVSVSIFR